MIIALKRAAHAAPGQSLGFALQPVRLCHHLLTAPPGALVSLEHLADVAVHYPDGSVLLEQCESALKPNPVSDRAADLRKTFSHWCEGCGRGGIDVLKARFSLYVVPTRAGKLVQAALRRSARDPDTIRVRVDGDKVALDGCVDARHERELAGRAAWSAPGVRLVEDRLTLAR